MATKLVILGCGGFIGSHLLDRLLPNVTLKIVGWDPDDRKIAHHLGRDNFVLYRHAVNEPETIEMVTEELQDADALLNLAAICTPAQYNTKPLRPPLPQ